MASKLYGLEWSHFCASGRFRDYETILMTFPNNLFQLNLWCEVLIVARIEELDIPDNAVFYLSDENYSHLLLSVGEREKMSIIFKLRLASYIFNLSTNESLLRNLEECVMTACSMVSFTHPQADYLKKTSIKNYLVSETVFLHENSLNKVLGFLKNRIQPTKQLKDVDNSILGTFAVQQLAHGFSHNQELRSFLASYQKVNSFYSIRDYITKVKNPFAMETAIFLAQNFNLIQEVLQIFENDPQPFYTIFYKIQIHSLSSSFKNFINFMLKYSSVKTKALHEVLHLAKSNKQKNYKTENMLMMKDYSIFELIGKKVHQTCEECLEVYLKWSNFKIPLKKAKATFCDPLSVIGILRKFWDDEYHSLVINYCIWILLDRLLLKIQRIESNEKELRNYSKTIFKVLIHIGMGYKLGSFVNYYPIEHIHLQELFALESLPTLLLNCPNYFNITWVQIMVFNSVNNELTNMFRFENGYEMISRLLSIKGNGVVQNYGNEWLVFIEGDFIQQRNSRFWQKNRKAALEIVQYFCGVRNLTERAERLRTAIEKQRVA